MKKSTRRLLALPVLLTFIGLGWLGFSRPDFALQLGSLNIVFAAVLVGVLLTPIGAKKIMAHSPAPQSLPAISPMNRLQWFSKLLLAQLGLGVLLITALVGFSSAGPHYIATLISPRGMINIVQELTLQQWGIFPWGIYAACALVMSYCIGKKGSPYFFAIAADCCSTRLAPAIKFLSTQLFRIVTMIVICLALVSGVLTIANGFKIAHQIDQMSLPFVTLMVLYAMTGFLGLKTGKRIFRGLFRLDWMFPKVLIFISVLFLAMLLFAAWVNTLVIHYLPATAPKLVCQQCEHFLGTVPPETRFAVLYMSWWLLWTPLAGSYIVRISTGRTLREMMIGLLVLPVIFGACVYLHPEWMLKVYEAIAGLWTPWLYYGLGLVSLIILCTFLAHVRHGLWFYGCNDLPALGMQNRFSLTAPPKAGGLSFYYHRIAIISILMLIMHTVAGWYGIQLQIALMAVMMTPAIFIGLCFYVVQIIRDKRLLSKDTIPEIAP